MRRLLFRLIFICSTLWGCASAPGKGPCGGMPVSVLVDSNHFFDVTIREARTGRRLGVARGLTKTRFTYCAYPSDSPVFVLDPLAGPFGFDLVANVAPEPGAVVVMSLGSQLQISFVEVVPPAL